MNGIVSVLSSRSKDKPLLSVETSLLGLCFLVGFLSGLKLELGHDFLNRGLHTQGLKYSALNWVSSESTIKLESIPNQHSDEVPESSFIPHILKEQRHGGRLFSPTKMGQNKIAGLAQLVNGIEANSKDIYSDFSDAARQLSQGLFLEKEASKPNLSSGMGLVKRAPRPTRKWITKRPTQVTLERPLQAEEQTEDRTPPRITLAANLTEREKNQLKEVLLETQWASRPSRTEVRAQIQRTPQTRQLVLAQNATTRNPNLSEAWTKEVALVSPKVISEPQIPQCNLIPDHQFVRFTPEATAKESTQVCPERMSWISKDYSGFGWIKVEGPEQVTTITRQPAPNGGATLVLDQNSFAALALTSGTRIMKGMGSITGLVPPGYKVEFAGRAEETQYFESNQRKYFAILNAEPGAGVVELISELDPNLSSTVFAPVLEDSATYLDLVAPERRDVPIRVVKSGAESDPEVSGLTLGVSTQNSIQAITQQNGSAILRGVNLVNGFPLFVDVGSKSGQENGFVYRYELGRMSKAGYYLLPQIQTNSLRHWMSKVGEGLSDQSALIVGSYDRKRIDGFKNLYHVKTESLTARLGLEPVTYSILWNGQISNTEPLEGDLPRFLSAQVAEGLSQVTLMNENNEPVYRSLIPVSPRIIHVVSE